MSKGPIYDVELIDSLPLGQFGTLDTLQAMPSAADLRRVREVSERTVAGYEVLLSHFRRLQEENERLDWRLTYCEDGEQLASNEARQELERLRERVQKLEWLRKDRDDLLRLIRDWATMSDRVCEHGDCGCTACVDLREAIRRLPEA